MNHLQRVLAPNNRDRSHGGCHSDPNSDATELDMGGQSCTASPKDAGVATIEHLIF